MQSMDEVRKAYKKLGRYFFHWLISMMNFTEYFTKRQSPHAALSISMVGCMEKGVDATDGGCKYNSFGGTAPGLATVADSLTTIKYLCFDKKICTTRELYDAFMANWEGYEDLRQYIIANVPHFGNGDPYADEEMKFCVETYYEFCDEATSIRAKKYKAGLYGASDHIAQGYVTHATPDGRKTGEPLSDAASPCQGRDKQGPTGIFESAVCYDHSRCMGGIALNVRMHPKSMESEDGVAKLRDLTKTYFDMGGLEVQYNVVDAKTMKAAQENPEDYRNLVVRIAGFSAYFVEMGEDLQNDVISRTENVI
jgi:formate C-acetyltransferase